MTDRLYSLIVLTDVKPIQTNKTCIIGVESIILTIVCKLRHWGKWSAYNLFNVTFAHNLTLSKNTGHLSDSNFITRNLYKNIYRSLSIVNIIRILFIDYLVPSVVIFAVCQIFIKRMSISINQDKYIILPHLTSLYVTLCFNS